MKDLHHLGHAPAGAEVPQQGKLPRHPHRRQQALRRIAPLEPGRGLDHEKLGPGIRKDVEASEPLAEDGEHFRVRRLPCRGCLLTGEADNGRRSVCPGTPDDSLQHGGREGGLRERLRCHVPKPP